MKIFFFLNDALKQPIFLHLSSHEIDNFHQNSNHQNPEAVVPALLSIKSKFKDSAAIPNLVIRLLWRG